MERAMIQVSSKELEDKNFVITVGNTHVVKDGFDYRVVDVKDASYLNQVQLKECELVKKISNRGFI